MRYMATIYVSDVMDLVALTLELQGWREDYGPPDVLGTYTFTWKGVGETDPQEWVCRALFLASEEMSRPPREGSRGGPPLGGPHTLTGLGRPDQA